MAATIKSVNVWLGSEPGILKAVNVVGKIATNYYDQSNIGKEQEIVTMCWDNEGQRSSISTGHKCGTVRNFNFDTGQFDSPISIPKFEQNSDKLVKIYRKDDSFVTCTEKGSVLVWNNSGDEENKISAEFNVGQNVYDMALDKEKTMFATGGKENMLKVFDLEKTETPIFKAKNVPHDWLQLRVPIWVTGIRFLDGTSKIVTTTGKSKIRLYDIKAEQRRPCLEMNFDEYPITSLTLTNNPNQVIVANTRGSVAMFDFRKKALVRVYKGFAGSVRCLQAHPNLEYIASCGLDRFLRIHDINSGKVEYKVYLKARLNCLLFSDIDFVSDARKAAREEQDETSERKRKLDEEPTGADDDKLWRKMRAVDDDSDSDSSSDDEEDGDESC